MKTKDRTKWALAVAFGDLLEKHSIEKITIQDIVDQGGFNRQTFYYHFRDIFDMMGWLINQILEKEEDRLPVGKDLEDIFRHVFHELREYRKLILHAYNPSQRSEYEKLFEPWLRRNLEESIRASDLADQVPDQKIEFMVYIFTWVSLGLIFQWLEDGMPSKTDEKLHDSFILFHTSVKSCLEKFAEEWAEEKAKKASQDQKK